jgi:hypothetical protein
MRLNRANDFVPECQLCFQTAVFFVKIKDATFDVEHRVVKLADGCFQRAVRRCLRDVQRIFCRSNEAAYKLCGG